MLAAADILQFVAYLGHERKVVVCVPLALFISNGRDALLSGTANLQRAYLRAGVDARLVVFDGLPHAFWYHPELPESIEANHIMAKFFVKELAK